MATPYGNIQQYRDPGQVDLTSTFKAQTYKQNLYDSNSSAVQQLVNKYVGTELLRDVDKQYLGERLNTLVNYVQNAGTLDWSRKSISDDVSNYIGQALDSNVLAGIASTQRYQKHQMEMAELKTKHPDQYSVQNDWASTRDLNRYLTSNKLGDVYRQNSYTPYTDVNKLITENLPKLKEFMIDVKYTSDGNPLLTRIDTHEVLGEQEASQYLNMILGERGNTQLAIDGMYKYRNNTADEVRSEYKGNLNNQIQSFKTQAKNFNVLEVGKTEAEKSAYRQRATQYEEMANQLKDVVGKVDSMDKDAIAVNMYSNGYKQNWSKLLSFDRVTDWKIDDRNFQIAKRNDDLAQKEWDRDFQVNKFQAEQVWKQKDYELDIAKAMGDGSITLDANGNPIAGGGTNASNSGITTTSNGTALEEGSSVLAEDVMENYSQAFNTAKENTKNYVNELMATEAGRNIIRQHYGNITEGDTDKLVFSMMRGTPDAQRTLSGIRDVMNKTESGRMALASIQSSIQAHRQKERMTPLLEEAKKGIAGIVKTVMSADNLDGEFFGLDQMVINKEGKAVKGSYLGRNYDTLNSQEQLGALIGGISNRLVAGKIDESERSALLVLQKNLIGQIKDPQARKTFNDYNVQQKIGLREGAEHYLSSFGQAFRKGYNDIAFAISGDDDNRKASEDASKTIDYNQRMLALRGNNINAKIRNRLTFDYTIDAVDSNDLKKNGRNISFGKDSEGYNQSAEGAYRSKVTPALKILDQRLQDSTVFKLNNKTLNFNTEDKNVKAQYESWFKAQFDSEIQNNANVRVNVNSEDGTVTVTAPVKDGKEYALATTAPISFSDIPENMRSMVATNQSFEYDARNNRNASPVYARGQVYDSDEKINELYGDLEIDPKAKRSTVEDVQQKVVNTIGQENYQRYKQEIDAIIRTPVDLEAKPVDGVYVMNFKSGNKVIDRQIMGNNITDQIDLIAEQRDKISVEKILQHIQRTYNK